MKVGCDHQSEPTASGGARTERDRRERAARALPTPAGLRTQGSPTQSGVGVRVGVGGQDRWGIL